MRRARHGAIAVAIVCVLGILAPGAAFGATAALPTLLPTADGTRDAAIQIRGVTLAFDAIDEGLAAADTTTYLQNQQKVSGRYFALLTDMPSDFTSIGALSISIRARTVGIADDQTTLFAQLFAADETTVLSNEVLVATNPGPTGWAAVSNVALSGLTPGSKATWEGARLRLRWAYTQIGTADSTQLRLTAVELHGTYDTGGGPSPDLTPPSLLSAAVNGATLTLGYDEPLDASSVPATGAFAIVVDATPRAVGTVGVSGSTVTLTLSSPVSSGQTVTASYTVPASGPVQDVAGNDAPAFSGRAVTNSTPGGGGGGGGTLPTLVPTADGSRDAAIQIRGVTLAFDAINEGLAAADTSTYLQDQQKVSGRYFALLTDMPSDFTALSSLTISIRARTVGVSDDQISLFAQLLGSDETTALSNEVLVATNPGSSGWATVSNVALSGLTSGSKAIWDGARLRIRWAYSPVGSADSAQLRLTVAELHGTYNAGPPPPDLTPPQLTSAAVNGSTLTLTYNEPLDGASIPAPGDYAILVNASPLAVNAIGIGGSTVTLTLASPVVNGDTVTATYAVPVSDPVQDVAGNDGGSFSGQAVTNNTPPVDVDPPLLSGAAVNGSSLTLTYNEALDAGSKPTPGDYAILVNASPRAVNAVGIGGSAVTLSLASGVANGDLVTASYIVPADPIQDLAGNDAAAFSGQPVTNNTPPPGGAVNASGNEITDTVRVAGIQGDGRSTDSSFGIWEAATNLDTNGGFENGSAAGWSATGGSFIASTEQAKFGSHSGKAVTTAPGDFVAKAIGGLSGSTTYGRSLWIYRTETVSTLTVVVLNNAGTGNLASATAPAVAGWSRIVLHPKTESSQTSLTTRIGSNLGGIAYFVDGAQLERDVVATPYVETNGSTATRGPSKVGVAGTPVGPTQGWVAVRIRFGWDSTTAFSPDPGIVDMSVSNNDALFCYWDVATHTFHLERHKNGTGTTAASAAQTFSAGTIKTVIYAWTVTDVRISVDGGAFVGTGNTTIPGQATLYIGSDQVQGNGSNRQGDSDYLWVAGGSGTLSDADAATIHAFADTDHPIGDFPGGPTFVWAAN